LISSGGWEFFSLTASRTSGVHPASYPVGTRGSFPGVKQLGHEADHSHASNAKVKE